MLFELVALGIAGHLVEKTLEGPSKNKEDSNDSNNYDSGPDLSYDNNVDDSATAWGPSPDGWGGTNSDSN
jgi:hypothetical protein